MSDTPEERRQINSQAEFDRMVRDGDGECANFDCRVPIEVTTDNCPKFIYFSNADFFEKVKFFDISIQNGGWKFDKVNFHAYVTFTLIKGLEFLTFDSVLFKKDSFIEAFALGTMILNKIESQKLLNFGFVSVEKRFSICKSTLEIVRLIEIKSQAGLNFNSVSVKKEFFISQSVLGKTEIVDSPCENMEISENKFSGKFKISQSDEKQYENALNYEPIPKVEIETLNFSNNETEKDTLVRFGYLDVTHFYFWNIRNPINSELNIGECNFTKWTFHGLRNSGKFRIYKINIGIGENESEDCMFDEASFGDSEFHNVNLRCYKTVSMKDNLFSNLHYTGMQWPDELKSSDMSNQQKRDTYRTLKKVTQENNDAPQAIKFYAKEMQIHKDIIFSKSGNKIDKIILRFNHWTNNFGLNWFLPIGWILGLGGLF